MRKTSTATPIVTLLPPHVKGSAAAAPMRKELCKSLAKMAAASSASSAPAASSGSSNGSGLTKMLDNYIIIDIGANLTNKKFSRDLDAVINRAKEAGKFKSQFHNDRFFWSSLGLDYLGLGVGTSIPKEKVYISLYFFLVLGVTKIMVTGTTLQASKDALRLARLNPGVLYSTAGNFFASLLLYSIFR